MIIALTLITSAQRVEPIQVTDLTHGPGIVAIQLPQAHMTDKYYSFIQLINLEQIKTELDYVKDLLKFKLSKPESLSKLYLYTRKKFDHLMLNKSKSQRPKRGLFNGLGKAISWITRNMDSDDKERYDKVINAIQNNSFHLQHNVESQMTINKN